MYIKRYGEPNLLDCLERNEKAGVVYHREGIIGDYYDFNDVEELIIIGNVFYLTYSHFFRSKTCPNVTDLNCLIFYEFFQKEKMPYKWRKRTNNVKNLQI